MRRPSISRIAVAFGLTVVLIGQQATQAKDVSFVVKRATYAGTGGVFRCEAKLSAGDTATMKLTVSKDHADSVFASIHTSYPAKLSQAAPDSKNRVVITVSVPSSTSVTAGITYLTKFVVADSYSIRYGIQRSAKKPDQAKLDGYLHVHDRSASDAQWSNAKLLIKRPRLDDICRINVNMDAGNTYISPIAELVKYAVKLAEPQPNYFRTSGEVAYEFWKLTNLGDQTLAAGNIRVMSAAGDFLYGTMLRENLSPTDPADLLTVPARSAKVSVNVANNRWHEAISVDVGELKYRPWSITVTTIENKNKKNEIQVYVENSNDAVKVGPSDKVVVPGSDGVKGTESSTYLFDTSKAKLEFHVAKLEEFSKKYDSVNRADLMDIRKIQKVILDLTKEIETLTTSIDTTAARVLDPFVDENVKKYLEERKDEMIGKRKVKESTWGKKIGELVEKVKKMDDS